ncbi:hypothetical protein ACL1FJ_00530 [Corynebacterium striatum]
MDELLIRHEVQANTLIAAYEDLIAGRTNNRRILRLLVDAYLKGLIEIRDQIVELGGTPPLVGLECAPGAVLNERWF